MRRLKRLLMIAVTLLWLTSPSAALAKGWEAVKPEKTQGHHVMSDSELEIMAGGGIIYVTTSRNVNIKIFTILGSRIADDNLQAGTYRFEVPTHGVYIIKAGDITCKVAV